MKILQSILILVLTIALMLAAGYLYASSGIKAQPGYVKLELPSYGAAMPIISVKLGPGGIGPARWVLEQVVENSGHNSDVAEQVLAEVMRDLNGVQLAVYKVDDNREHFEEAISASAAKLKSQGWETLVRVRERDEHVVIMQAANDRTIDGLSLLVSNDENAVFINLIGPFDPHAIATVAAQL